jgi:hypothetical protein
MQNQNEEIQSEPICQNPAKLDETMAEKPNNLLSLQD